MRKASKSADLVAEPRIYISLAFFLRAADAFSGKEGITRKMGHARFNDFKSFTGTWSEINVNI